MTILSARELIIDVPGRSNGTQLSLEVAQPGLAEASEVMGSSVVGSTMVSCQMAAATVTKMR